MLMVMVTLRCDVIAVSHREAFPEAGRTGDPPRSSLMIPKGSFPYINPTRRGLQEKSDHAKAELFFEDDAYEKEDKEEFYFETDPLMYTFLSTRCPVHLRQSVKGQSVVIDPVITTKRSYLLHCVLVKQGQSTPSSLFLLSSLTQSPSSPISSVHPRPLVLSAASAATEMALVRGVSCIVATLDAGYFSPIFLTTPLDLRDESPAVSIVIAAVTAASVRFRVTPSVACNLWCDVFPAGDFPPTIGELQRHGSLFIRDETSVEKNGLIPGSQYAVYCYAESPRGSPMASTLVDSRGSFTTKEGTMRLADWQVGGRFVQFAVTGNLNRLPECLINGQFPSNIVHGVFFFVVEPGKPYHLECVTRYETVAFRVAKDFVTPSERSGRGFAFCAIVVMAAGIVAARNVIW